MRHFTFSSSAAGCMRQALASLGRNERVFGLDDDLAAGPINPPSTINRTAWWEKELGAEDWYVEAATMGSKERFWDEAMSGAPDRVIWVCRKCAFEYCGFLELISRLSNAPYLVVDATDETFAYDDTSTAKRYSILGLGELAPEAFLRNGLFDRAAPLNPATRAADLATWQRLRAENAPLRVVTPTGLVSAPLDHFDATLLSFLTPRWQKMARIIANVFAVENSANVGEIVLAARLRALARAGRIELQGSGLNIRRSEVRLPA